MGLLTASGGFAAGTAAGAGGGGGGALVKAPKGLASGKVSSVHYTHGESHCLSGATHDCRMNCMKACIATRKSHDIRCRTEAGSDDAAARPLIWGIEKRASGEPPSTKAQEEPAQ